MTEQEIINLGFEKEYGENEKFYYYTLNISDDPSPLCLISNANDEVVDENWWYVSILSHNNIKFKTRDQLRDFIYLLKNL